MENFLWAADSGRVLRQSFFPRNEEGFEVKEWSFTPLTPNPALVPTVAIKWEIETYSGVLDSGLLVFRDYFE